MVGLQKCLNKWYNTQDTYHKVLESAGTAMRDQQSNRSMIFNLEASHDHRIVYKPYGINKWPSAAGDTTIPEHLKAIIFHLWKHWCIYSHDSVPSLPIAQPIQSAVFAPAILLPEAISWHIESRRQIRAMGLFFPSIPLITAISFVDS